MKYIFIVNPISGKGYSMKIAKRIEEVCIQRQLDYEIRYTNKPREALEIAKEYKKCKNIIYSVGGDGTLNEVLNGIVGTKNLLGVVPAGSGNDFYKSLETIDDMFPRIDVGKLNKVYFINIVSFGIDAEVANNVSIFKEKKVPRKLIYNASIIYILLKFKSKQIEFTLNKAKKSGDFTIVTICNGRYYGGGYKIAPNASLTDNLFDIYFVDKMHKFQMTSLIPKLKKGEHESHPYVHKRQTNHIKIKSDKDMICNIDGEIIKDNKFNIKLMKNELTIYNDKELIKEFLE